MMPDFSQRFEIIYNKYAVLVERIGAKPSELGFSRFMDVVQATMQRWKKGQIPTGKDLKKIHDKLGFSYDWLISGEGEPEDLAAGEMARLKAENDWLRARLLADGAIDAIAHAAGQE